MILNNKPQKLQFQLTLRFSIFFILLSGSIYLYFVQEFKEDARKPLESKAKIILHYLEQNPESLWQKKIQGREKISELLRINDAEYAVILDNNGKFIDAFNITSAEEHLYINTENSESIALDKLLYKFVLPITANRMAVGKLYIGFKSSTIIADLNKRILLLALFSLTILALGIVFTYFLSSIAFSPLRKIITALDTTIQGGNRPSVNEFKNNELGVLQKERVSYQ